MIRTLPVIDDYVVNQRLLLLLGLRILIMAGNSSLCIRIALLIRLAHKFLSFAPLFGHVLTFVAEWESQGLWHAVVEIRVISMLASLSSLRALNTIMQQMHLIFYTADVAIVDLHSWRINWGERVAYPVSVLLLFSAKAEHVQLLQSQLIDLGRIRYLLLIVEVGRRYLGLAQDVIVACNLRKLWRLRIRVSIILILLILWYLNAIWVLIVIGELLFDHLQMLLPGFLPVSGVGPRRALAIGTSRHPLIGIVLSIAHYERYFLIAVFLARVAIINRTIQKIGVVLIPVVLQQSHVSRNDIQLPVKQRDLHDQHFQRQVTEDVEE